MENTSHLSNKYVLKEEYVNRKFNLPLPTLKKKKSQPTMLIIFPFQVAFWKFDDMGAVLEYDAWIPTIRHFQSATTPNPPSNIDTILAGCATAQTLCQGSNTQYKSTKACTDFFSSIPFGDYDNIWANSVVCRQFHFLLARIRPDVSFSLIYFSYFSLLCPSCIFHLPPPPLIFPIKLTSIPPPGPQKKEDRKR